MLGLILIAVLAIPALLCWLILRSRERRDNADDDFDGTYDRAPLNPVPLREYTVTGEMEFPNPPPGYTSPDPPRD